MWKIMASCISYAVFFSGMVCRLAFVKAFIVFPPSLFHIRSDFFIRAGTSEHILKWLAAPLPAFSAFAGFFD